MHEILINILGTIIGGLLLATILFFLNEHVFPIRNLTGEWNVKSLTEKTLRNPYHNMKLFYKFHLLQKGQEIIGSGEKIKEELYDGTTQEYKRKKRVLSEINGYYERNFFGKSKVYLNIVENGQSRQSRTTYILTIKNKNLLSGTFTSTIADSSGNAKLTKS